MELKAVIFDVDGTLSESEDVHREAFNEAFRAKGLDFHWDSDLYGELLQVAGGKERLAFFFQNYTPTFEVRSEQAFKDLIDDLHARKTAIFAEKVAAGALALRPGIERLIEEIRRSDIRLAVATTTSLGNLRSLTMSTMGRAPEDIFDVLSTGDGRQRKKPAPDVYRRTLESLGLNGENCLAIEDSEIGLRAALAADIGTLITVNKYTEGQNFAGALAVVDHLGEEGQPARLLEGEWAEMPPVIDLEALRRLHGLQWATEGEEFAELERNS